MTMRLSETVTVSRRFQRSIRIDTDLESAAALEGFICNGSARLALESTCKAMLATGQRAFTWTGPYGGGKSSLALALASAVSSDAKLRKVARSILGEVDGLAEAFPSPKEGWLVLPVMGHRGDPVADLRGALATARQLPGAKKPRTPAVTKNAARTLIQQLQSEASARPRGGVLVLLDEMGKFLEGAAEDGADIHFFQELAEAASRTEGRLIVVGILHQAFEQYAFRLGREARDEWAKVQGRFVDIPIVTAVDEVIDLLGQAIVTEAAPPASARLAGEVALAIAERRPGSPPDLGGRLQRCWPLHPITAALLGPVSRRRFVQNERSIFGFLNSAEPEGFQEFLRSKDATDNAGYDPARLWNYLQINLGPAILASPDSHRWAQGAEAVERAEARGEPKHVRLVKTVAIIELFRNGSGLVAELPVLATSFPDLSDQEIITALDELTRWSILVYRKHLKSWGVYAGSDFDIDQAVEETKASMSELNLARLASLAGLQPLVAKQHYHRTGTLRWFETELVPLHKLKETASASKPRSGASGRFILVLPDQDTPRKSAQQICQKVSHQAGAYPVAIGLPHNAWLLREHGADLLALEAVQTTRPELEGDAVARREIRARIAAISAQLEEHLRDALASANWHVRGEVCDADDAQGLARFVSTLADETFPRAPIIHSELVNREKPSSNSQAAIRQLLYAMVDREGEAMLGIEGFSAERGLYSTVLEVAGLHCRGDGKVFRFRVPAEGDPFGPIWAAANEALAQADAPVSFATLYRIWSEPPFGLRRGILPIIAMAYLLSKKTELAVYAKEVFKADFDTMLVDLLLQDEGQIAIQQIDLSGENAAILEQLADAVEEVTGQRPDVQPLTVARALVRLIFQLPQWTRRTSTLSERGAVLRKILLNASDPHRALFVDLPVTFQPADNDSIGIAVAEALCELVHAYPAMLRSLAQSMLAALSQEAADLAELHERAKTVAGVSGDLRLDAFASRLAAFDGTDLAMEGIASLCINKPTRDWSDRDPDRAAVAIAEFALQFRKIEVLARIKGREPTRYALAVAFGTGEKGATAIEAFDISSSERLQASELAANIVRLMSEQKVDKRLILAALAEAGMQTLKDAAKEDDRQKVAS